MKNGMIVDDADGFETEEDASGEPIEEEEIKCPKCGQKTFLIKDTIRCCFDCRWTSS